MDYKKLIERLQEKSQSWVSYEDQGLATALQDAADGIKRLLEERESAVDMLHGQCHACKNNRGWHNVGKCGTCIHETARFPKKEERKEDNWEWLGQTQTHSEETGQ